MVVTCYAVIKIHASGIRGKNAAGPLEETKLGIRKCSDTWHLPLLSLISASLWMSALSFFSRCWGQKDNPGYVDLILNECPLWWGRWTISVSCVKFKDRGIVLAKESHTSCWNNSKILVTYTMEACCPHDSSWWCWLDSFPYSHSGI